MAISEEESAYLRELGARIFIARRRKGLIQKDLAVMCGCNPITISRIERGTLKTSIIRLRQIKVALDMDWNEVFPPKEPKH